MTGTTDRSIESKPTWLEAVVGERLPPFGPVNSLADIARRRQLLAHPALAVDPGPTIEFESVMISDAPASPLEAEIARPRDRPATGLIVYMHGGAWCAWSPREVRRCAFALAHEGFVVLSVGYALAPERPFPAAVEDVVYAVRWATKEFDRLRAPGPELVLAGDSSGANLAAAALAYFSGEPCPLDGRDLDGRIPTITGALLLCGTYDFVRRMAAERHVPGVTELMSNYAYLGPQFLSRHRDPLVSPAYAVSLPRFPPVYLSCGSGDAVLGESLHMAERLAHAGVDVTLSVVPGCDHEFLLAEPLRPAARAEFERICEWLHQREEAL